MPSLHSTLLVLPSLLAPAASISLDTGSRSSLFNASATLANGLTSYYQNNASSTPDYAIGTLPAPLYWWEAGAVWGALIDYWATTNDTSYNPTVTEALLAQRGPGDDFMMPQYYTSLGNDDQAFWILAALSAVKYDFPAPSGAPGWLDLATAAWETQAARWDTEVCNGGLRWQIFESNAGFEYKNSISNGAFFQISARLARYTGNQTYVDWAERVWDWMEGVDLIGDGWEVFDGTDAKINCSEVDHTIWSYNPGMMLYGTAVLGNSSGDGERGELWRSRTEGLFGGIVRTFFNMDNASNVLFEPTCEPSADCNNDQQSFKAYLARFLAKSALVAPYLLPAIRTLLATSAEAAAESCTGGEEGQTCGSRWYVDGYDGMSGVGQELSALETVVGVLAVGGEGEDRSGGDRQNGGGAGRLYPDTASGVTVAQWSGTSTYALASATAAPEGGSGSGGGGDGNGRGGGGGGGSGGENGGDGNSDGGSGENAAATGLQGGLGWTATAALMAALCAGGMSSWR